jgi:hypothetical protein
MQTANVKWIGDERFVATGPSGHAVTIDSDRKSNTAMGPMEMLLMAGGVHGDGHRDHSGEEAAEAGVLERGLLGRAGGSCAGSWMMRR